MPLKRSSNSSNGVKIAMRKSKGSSESVGTLERKYKTADRADRKVKAAAGKFRSSSDGVRTEETKNNLADIPHRKVERATRKSKQSTDGVKTVEYKEQRSKKVQSRGNGNDAAPYGNVNEKSGKIHGRGQRDLKTKGGDSGCEVVIDGNSGGKRKRIYADAGLVEDRLYDKKLNRKPISKAQKNAIEPYLDNGKNKMWQKPRGLETFGKDEAYAGSRTFKRTEFFDKKNVRIKLEGADELKHVRERRLGNRIMKKSVRRNALLPTKSDTNYGNYDSAERPRRDKVQDKKSFATDSGLREDPPKKKKRVIRIDPYDISNKRLDDAISNNGNSEDKKDLAETSEVEMSKNAQFRAIIPSSSIISFVDDNLLGRRREIEFKRTGYNIELSAPLDNIPFSTKSERERIEVPVFNKNKLEFFAAAKISSSFPPPELPEIAFAGRSNVGKSSLLNALTRQWGSARTSDKPGLTQSINFFKLGPTLSLVDLPGYGFAYAKEEVKDAWEELVKEYVASRASLKRVCLLVDTKWGLKPRDYELIDLMERSQTKYQIVLTKTDLVFPIDVARRAMQIEENLKAKKSAVQPLMMASARTGAGIRSLRTALANIVRFVK